MPQFTFTLDNFQITDTRSAHKDTDFAAFTLKIGSAAPLSAFAPLGDRNNGTFGINLAFSGVEIDPGTSVVLNYLIVNAGSSATSLIQSTLETLGARLANVPSFNLPPMTSCLQLVASKFADEISQILHSQCDGLVAAEQNSLTYNQLVADANQVPFFSKTTNHVGTASPHGCNARPSNYNVHWTMKEAVITVPSVLQMTLTDAEKKLAKLGLQGHHFTGPGDWVVKQSPNVGQPSPTGFVDLTTMIQP